MKIAGVVPKYLSLWLAVSACLLPMVSCTASPTTPSPPGGGELATYQMEIDLLGAQHTLFLDSEGRLMARANLSSIDGAISLSMDAGTTILDEDGKPLSFLQTKVDAGSLTLPENAYIIGATYDFRPRGVSFNPPLKLTLSYDPEELPEEVRERDLYIAPYDEDSGWGNFYYRRVDTESHRVTTQVSDLAKYAVLAPREPPEPPPPPDLTAIPLEQALSSGKPTLAEFGSSKCIPCKMMKPILENLAIIYGDKLNVVIVEVYEHRDLTNQHGIMAIPTQIFFDSSGKEVTRHMGFWPKEEIIAQLKKMGVD